MSAKDVWNHRIDLPGWVQDRWPQIQREDWQASSLLRSSYGHSRMAKDLAKQALAGQTAIITRLDGGDDGAVRAAIREELARAAQLEREERQAEQAELAALVAQAQSGELDAAAVVDELARRLADA